MTERNDSKACAGVLLLKTIFACLLFLIAASEPASAARFNGTDYISLKTVAAKLGMDYLPVRGKRLHLKSKWTALSFGLHDRYYHIKGVKVYFGYPIARHRGDYYISEGDFEHNIRTLLTPQVFEPVPKLYRIVIDPGHGGKDPGAENKGLGVNEKGPVLDLAKRMKKRLGALGYKVILTRDTDKFLSLSSRPKIANKNNADLFVSLHFNSFPSDRRVRGVETYCLTPRWQPSTSRSRIVRSDKLRFKGNENDPWNALVAYYVQTRMVKELWAKDRGVKRARFKVLKELKCPGILVEGGFLSNTGEAKKVKTATYREKLARSIVNGIVQYQKTINRLRGK